MSSESPRHPVRRKQLPMDQPILRSIRLSERDWMRAQRIGDGDATRGIRAALAELIERVDSG